MKDSTLDRSGNGTEHRVHWIIHKVFVNVALWLRCINTPDKRGWHLHPEQGPSEPMGNLFPPWGLWLLLAFYSPTPRPVHSVFFMVACGVMGPKCCHARARQCLYRKASGVQNCTQAIDPSSPTTFQEKNGEMLCLISLELGESLLRKNTPVCCQVTVIP